MKDRIIEEITLPKLLYDYDSLEPYYDEETLRLHHDIHHAGYVKGFNKALKELSYCRLSKSYELLPYQERELVFNGSGHILHSIFWENMTPNKTNLTIELGSKIERDFGSFNTFTEQFTNSAKSVEGNGWSVLFYVKRFDLLVINQILNHQNLYLIGSTPILVIDVWEHAYYLKYKNKRSDWIDSWWNIVNWEDVSNRFKEA